MIDLKDVTWTYAGQDRAVLDELSLHIEPGETVALCGASGSGKSTVLRLMNGLIPHFHDGTLAGCVEVAGLDVAKTPLDRLGRRTGTVLQHPRRQFFTDTVADELAFALENFGTGPDIMRDRVTASAREHRLDQLTSRRLGALSGGQQQAVACAAASTHAPDVLLFDEPTSNLSAQAIDRFARTLGELKGGGATIVIAEHRLHILRGLADRIIVLRDGHIHMTWTARQFADVSDDVLEDEGLRAGHIQPVQVAAAAAGRSITTATAPPRSGALSGLELRDLRCRLGHRDVLDIEYAHLPGGQVTAIRGDNGAGKTTLARIITGLQRHDGQVLLDGHSLGRRQRQSRCAIVMQDVQRQLFTESVDAELALAATTIDDTDLLERLDLDDLGDRHPLSLSGGQQQRLVIATAQLTRSPIVVFDEPSSGVDRRHLQSISTLIGDLADDGAVVLLISHDDDLIARTADTQLELTTLGRPTSP